MFHSTNRTTAAPKVDSDPAIGESYKIDRTTEKSLHPPSLHRRFGRQSNYERGRRGAMIGLSDGQNVQMKAQRSPCVITGDPRHTCAHAAKSSTAQTPRLSPIERQHSRARHRQLQTVAKLTAFMTAIRRFIKGYAIPWQKLYACFSEHTFHQGNRVLVSRVATHLNVRDRVSMQTARLSQVPNYPERGPSDLVQLPWARKCAHLTCDKVKANFTTSPNQGAIK
jgi:hypothetical protein